MMLVSDLHVEINACGKNRRQSMNRKGNAYQNPDDQ